MTSPEYRCLFLDLHKNSGNYYENIEIERNIYYKFWRVLENILKIKDVFVYVCGKGTALPLIGTGNLVRSPGYLIHLFLEPLNSGHIKEIITSPLTNLPKITIDKYLGLDSNIQTVEIEHLAKWVAEFSSGIPRIIMFTLASMCRCSIPLAQFSSLNNNELEKLREEITDLILLNIPSALPTWNVWTSTIRQKIFLLALLRTPLLKTATLEVARTETSEREVPTILKVPILNVVNSLGIYTTPTDEPAYYRLVIPGIFIIDIFREVERNGVWDIYSSLNNMIAPALMGEGKVLEESLKISLIYKYLCAVIKSKDPTLGEAIPLLKNTVVANISLSKNNLESVVKYIPRVSMRAANMDMMPSEFGKKILEQVGSVLSGFYIFSLPPRSASPDIINWVADDTYIGLIGIQAKDWRREKGVGLSVLIEEIKKFVPLLDSLINEVNEQNLHYSVKGLFILVSDVWTKEINELISQERIERDRGLLKIIEQKISDTPSNDTEDRSKVLIKYLRERTLEIVFANTSLNDPLNGK